MAEILTVAGYNGSAWNINIGDLDRIGFCGSEFGSSISVGGFQGSTHKTNGTLSIDGCATNHMRNNKYISPTQVSLNGNAAVPLDIADVSQNDCTTRWSYQDDAQETSIFNAKFFAFNGSDINNAPAGVILLAFEHAESEIRKDRASDTPGDGGAWDAEKGIGGIANALLLSERLSAPIHHFFIGLSVSPTTKGLKTAIRFRLEFDAQ